MKRTFRVTPRYLPYAPGTKHHAFQQRILGVATQDKGVLIVTAPTGAGKTWALAELAKDSGGLANGTLLVISPTNALSTQMCYDLRHAAIGITVARWASADIRSCGIERNLEMINQVMRSNVVVSNPDLVHLLTVNYYARRNGPQRHRTFEDVMARFGIHVFDEYHSYDERMMASVLTYMVKARQFHACRHHRYVFMSATPNQSLVKLLDEFGFDYDCTEEREAKELTADSRPTKGALEVEFTTEPMEEVLRQLPPPGRPEPRTLVVFDSFMNEERMLRRLLDSGYSLGSDDGIVAMTGRDTKSEEGQAPWDKCPIIFATSKADLGLNIDKLDLLIMEKGWTSSQFWQRFGRAGRGREARVVIVLPEDYAQLIASANLDGMDGIEQIVSKLHSSQKFSSDRVYDYVGFHLAATEHLIRKAGLREAIQGISELPGRSSQSRGLMRSSCNLPDKFSGVCRTSVENLVERLIRSMCLLRGQALEVTCTYPRPMTTRENLIYILKYTNYQIEQGSGNYIVSDFLTEPRERIILTYPGVPNEIKVEMTRGKSEPEIWREYVEKLVKQLRKKSDEETDMIGSSRNDPFEALELVLTRLEPDTLAPCEVNLDEQFI